MLAHAYRYNQACVPIFGTWFPFHHSYLLERLDDQDYEPRISANRFSGFDFRRQVASVYFQFDREKRKPNSLAYFFQ